MSKLVNQLTDVLKRFDEKQIKKLKIFKIIRVMEKLEEVDCEQVNQIAKAIEEKLNNSDMNNRKELKAYQKLYKAFVKEVRKRHPEIANSVVGARFTLIAASSTVGPGSTVSPGSVGASVAYATNLKFEDGSKKEED